MGSPPAHDHEGREPILMELIEKSATSSSVGGSYFVLADTESNKRVRHLWKHLTLTLDLWHDESPTTERRAVPPWEMPKLHLLARAHHVKLIVHTLEGEQA